MLGAVSMNGARPGGAEVTPDTRWMTYQEMADRLGTDAESARRRAEREGWPSLPGNDGQTRVGVPGNAVGLGNTPDAADEGDDRAVALAALREALAREQDRADRAEAAAAAVPELRDRAARAEGERDALREALLAAKSVAEDAGRRARAAEEQAAAAHRRAAEIASVLGPGRGRAGAVPENPGHDRRGGRNGQGGAGGGAGQGRGSGPAGG